MTVAFVCRSMESKMVPTGTSVFRQQISFLFEDPLPNVFPPSLFE